MMRFLPWYVAAVLAAYAVSASWSLGMASEQVATEQQKVQELSALLEQSRPLSSALAQGSRCAGVAENCLYTD